MATNILVVEDQRSVAGALRMRLRGLGYGVLDIAKDADEAITKAAALKPDLILMDIRLGDGMDGIEAARRIRVELDIPVVYVTAYADRDLLERARDTHPAGFINKPFTTKDLLTTINLALDQESAQPRSTALLREAVITADNQGRISFINAAAERLTGWTRREVIGRSLGAAVSMLYHIPAFAAERLIEDVLAAGREHRLPLGPSSVSGAPDVLAPLNDPDGARFGAALHFGAETMAASTAGAHRALSAMQEVLDQLPLGVILLDREGQIVRINAYARDIIAAGTVLEIDAGRLRARASAAQETLQALLRAAADDEPGAEDAAGELVLLGGDEPGTRVAAIVTATSRDYAFAGPSMLTVTLFDLAHRRTLSATVLRQIYGLTRAEVNLVQTLVGGCSLEDGARELGIALNTARTHLKHIFHKTGAKRQSELIHQIETGPASMPIRVRDRG
ncbi:MAG: response regulator [Gammaproteobacteria bacterium]